MNANHIAIGINKYFIIYKGFVFILFNNRYELVPNSLRLLTIVGHRKDEQIIYLVCSSFIKVFVLFCENIYRTLQKRKNYEDYRNELV